MTFTRFVQYIESIRRSCLLVGWLFSQFLFSSSISLYLSISLVPVWLFLIYACILCCFFCFTIHCCVFQFHTVCEWCCFLLFAVPFSFYILVFRLDLTNSESTTTTTYIKVHAYRHIGIVYTFLLLGLAWPGLDCVETMTYECETIQYKCRCLFDGDRRTYTDTLICWCACMHVCLCRGFWNCVTHRIHAQLGMCALNVCKRRT